MLRYLRSALPAVVCVLIAASGMSYALTSSAEEPTAPPVEETSPPEDGGTVDTDPVPSEPPVVDPDVPEEDPVTDPVTDPVVDPLPDEGTDEEAETPDAPSEDAKFSTDGCPEGFSGNHGQFVSSTEERPRNDAAHSTCGKPTKDDEVPDEEADEDTDGSSPTSGKGKAKDKNKDKD
jgi:hypothetical protein